MCSQVVIKKEYASDSPGHVEDAKYFYFNSEYSDKNSIKILCGGYEKCASDFRVVRDRFPFYAMIFTVNGKGYYDCLGQRNNLQYGAMSFVEPNIPYILEADCQTPMEHYFVICTGKGVKNLFEKGGVNTTTLTVRKPQLISLLFEDLLQAGFNKAPYCYEICEKYITSIILSQAEHNPINITQSSSYQSFLRCKRYADSNLTRLKSAAQLADECCLDMRYIARLFRKYEHMRPYDYLMRLKIDKAINLLLASNLNIKQIALMSGFDDPYHFSRIFKKRFNLSPSQYRNNIVENNGRHP